MISKFNPKKFCNGDITKIENYDKAIADQVQMWECHHRLETHFSDGTLRPMNARISRAELIALDIYWSRPPEELIFLTKKEHQNIHNIGKPSLYKGVPRTEEVRQKVSKAKMGHTVSEETRRKLSEFRKGKDPGRWYNNGTKNVRAFECPEGFVPGRLPFDRKPMSEEQKLKISETMTGKHWKLIDGKRVWY